MLPEPSHTTKMESFATTDNGFQPLPIVAGLFVLDIYRGPSYTSAKIEHCGLLH